MSSWGYPEKQPDTVAVQVPAHLVDTVAAFVSDPDGFLERYLEVAAERPPFEFIEIHHGVWVNPSKVGAIIERDNRCSLYVTGVDGHINVPLTVQQVTARMSDPSAML